ncbi:MAG: aldolase/citrate lyase family protein [Chloroflexota bacterium]
MRRNRLRELLNEGKATLGTHVLVPWPGVVEVIGHAGVFDYIEYVGEYSSWSLEQMDNFGRALELFPNLSGMMKVEEPTRAFIAQRAIDAGIQNVLFTDCRSAEDVKECIRYVRPETPEAGGVHGSNMRRGVGYVLEAGSANWVKAMNETVIAIMIEKRGAMEHLKEILAVPGVDVVQFGPSDYSISVGKVGGSRSPEVRAVEREMITTAHKMGIPARVEINTFEEAKPYLELGVRHFCIGWDLRVLYEWCRREGESMRKLLA